MANTLARWCCRRLSSEGAQARLKSVQIELACTERVVSEQVTTESALQKQGGELQSEVSPRRGERDRLLDKVGRLADQESLRHATTSKFVAEVLVACQEKLLKGVGEMLDSTSAESSQLCGGVLEMLSLGKDTCGSLKAAIDAALVALIRDAEKAKVDMTTSCGELDEHLRGTRDSLTTVLTRPAGQPGRVPGRGGRKCAARLVAAHAAARAVEPPRRSPQAQLGVSAAARKRLPGQPGGAGAAGLGRRAQLRGRPLSAPAAAQGGAWRAGPCGAAERRLPRQGN